MISRLNYYLTVREVRGQEEITVSSAGERFVPRVIPDLGVNRIFGADKAEGLSGALVVRAVLLGYKRSGASMLVVGDLG